MKFLNTIFERIIGFICKKSYQKPFVWILIALLFCIPAYFQITKVRLDTDAIRLLPKNSQAAIWTKKLMSVVGQRNFFYVLLEGNNNEILKKTVEMCTSRINELKDIKSIEYQYPVDFIKKYRFLLIPSEYLAKILETFLQWESEINPLTDNLFEEDHPAGDIEENKDKRVIENLLDLYCNLPHFHQSHDGKIMGIIIFPEKGVHKLNDVKQLFFKTREIVQDIASGSGIEAYFAGPLSRWIRGYDVIISDLKRSGIVMFFAVIIVLFIGFRSFRVIPVLLFPLTVGLIWALALVPLIVKELNTITSFLMQVAFGLGIDFSIHFVKRYQKELKKKSSFDALLTTYLTTGRSILLSGLTTSLALLVLIVSDFRGISEFGLVGGVSLLMILISMFLVMPAVISLGSRFGLLKKQKKGGKTIVILNPLFTAFVLIIICGSVILALFQLKFDFDFNNLEPKKAEPLMIKKKQDQVYAESYAPSEIYVAPDLSSLDHLVSYLKREKKKNPDTKIGWIRSIRDFCPDETEISKRIDLIGEIKKNLTKRWVNRIKDPRHTAWTKSIKNWNPPSTGPEINKLPQILKKHFMTKDNSNKYLVSIYSNTNRKDGKKAIEFTKEINGIKTPENIQGPVGGTLVFAEILWLVTSEGLWLIMMTFLGVMVLIFFNQRSLTDTLWILLPLISGMILTVGIMSFLGLKVNFFNIVVIPALLGMGVDDGIHYFRLWKENKGDIKSTQKTLFGPLTITTLTTMLGYAGMVFANHPGLHSIGLLACIGLTCTWFTSLFLFPNILNYFQKRKI